ncbi:unnamed protein product [Bursaphelenchus xylophilus]|uniref:(pine wood nematode) hypothetical protein n=1 Tax=Bursaphelenchus xylophilus TaxID=6326 RepID=A0A1I7S9C4_BURXY|nr:unnamed protein product [Bursaphelenchus xylophilus]CAG9100517.1 unnamed protein product [Bursaphelenchus xylophilus]
MKVLIFSLLATIVASANGEMTNYTEYTENVSSEVVYLTVKLHKIMAAGGLIVDPIELGVRMNYFIYQILQLSSSHGIGEKVLTEQMKSHRLLLNISDNDLLGEGLKKYVEQLGNTRQMMAERVPENYLTFFDGRIEMLEAIVAEREVNVLPIVKSLLQQLGSNESPEKVLALFYRAIQEAYTAGESAHFNPVSSVRRLKKDLLAMKGEELGDKYDDLVQDLHEFHIQYPPQSMHVPPRKIPVWHSVYFAAFGRNGQDFFGTHVLFANSLECGLKTHQEGFCDLFFFIMFKTVGHIPNKLPGRHRCECQARVHGLIRNCTGCGRIVCEQEGSGPCVFCGKFVCTKEEENIIMNDKKRGMQLEKDLMKKAGYGSDLSRSREEAEAEKYRDQLLKADRESVVRNRVLDLDSDYYNVENGHYLTAEERKAIQKRKEELHRQRLNRKDRGFKMDLDFASGSVKEIKLDNDIEKEDDEVIQGILNRAEERRERERHQQVYQDRREDLPNVDSFPARYDPKKTVSKDPKVPKTDWSRAIYLDKDERYTETERQGWCLSLPQPKASALLRGDIWYTTWPEEVNIEGPIFIASTESPSDNLQAFSVLGRIVLNNCVTIVEFKDENPEITFPPDVTDLFVLTFDSPEPLGTPLPYVSKSELHRLPSTLQLVLRRM